MQAKFGSASARRQMFFQSGAHIQKGCRAHTGQAFKETFGLFFQLSIKHADSILPLCKRSNSFPLDYAARQKIGGQHLTYFNVEQFPVIPPERYNDDWQGVKLADFITARVLELCYTAHDLKGFADDLGHTGPPFAWDEERRLHLKCQLDALFFHLYGLTEGEAGEILDTFPIVKRQDEARYSGKFRTRDLILGYSRAYAAGNMDAWVKG